MPDRVSKVVLASPVASFDETGVTSMLVLEDLKIIAKIRRMRVLVRWALKTEAKKINHDVRAYVESIADELPNEAETVLRNPQQQTLFEENFRPGFEQNEEGAYEMTRALWDGANRYSFVDEDRRVEFVAAAREPSIS